jgi:hypothetical protein
MEDELGVADTVLRNKLKRGRDQKPHALEKLAVYNYAQELVRFFEKIDEEFIIMVPEGQPITMQERFSFLQTLMRVEHEKREQELAEALLPINQPEHPWPKGQRVTMVAQALPDAPLPGKKRRRRTTVSR